MPEKIEIKSNGSVSNIFIDGTDISNMCVAADIKLRAGEQPRINIECGSLHTILYRVEHELASSDKLVKAAMAILRKELMKHGDLYNGYLASVEIALKENGVYEPDIEYMAKHILSRIIGED